jgi:hypothetical protein
MSEKQHLYAVVESRTDRLFDGPYRSWLAANEAATRANQMARECGMPVRYFVREVA